VESGGFRPGLLQGGEIRIRAPPQVEEFRVRFFRLACWTGHRLSGISRGRQPASLAVVFNLKLALAAGFRLRSFSYNPSPKRGFAG